MFSLWALFMGALAHPAPGSAPEARFFHDAVFSVSMHTIPAGLVASMMLLRHAKATSDIIAAGTLMAGPYLVLLALRYFVALT
jgi:hypothetical protein